LATTKKEARGGGVEEPAKVSWFERLIVVAAEG